eukprot:COSAG02_NODE_8240_length_2645_cov_2.058130_3_plen_85_part_00
MDEMPLASSAANPFSSSEGGDGGGGADVVGDVVVVVGEEPLYRCSICMEEDTRERMIAACHCASCVHPVRARCRVPPAPPPRAR